MTLRIDQIVYISRALSLLLDSGCHVDFDKPAYVATYPLIL
jgi:hypothetical protein